MRVSPDASAFTAFTRDSFARRDSATLSRQSAISEAYARRAAPAPKTAALAKDAARQEPSDAGQSQQSGRREAPLGQRPKFIPKGQSINILV